MAGWALRTFRGRGKLLMVTVLRSLIQSRLDYCSQLWSPRDQRSINLLESVQRNFINKIRSPDLVGKTYREKLSSLQVYSQERRRERWSGVFARRTGEGARDGKVTNKRTSDFQLTPIMAFNSAMVTCLALSTA